MARRDLDIKKVVGIRNFSVMTAFQPFILLQTRKECITAFNTEAVKLHNLASMTNCLLYQIIDKYIK